MRGLRSALCIATVFVLSWKLFICLVGGAALVVLGSRFWHWLKPGLHRFAAACILLLCQPRPIDGKLYHFCYPDHA
jgi:hypothetical protein